MRNFFRNLLVLVTLILCICSFAGCSLFNSNSGNNNSNDSNTSQDKPEFASGSGTEEDPYIIAEDYQWNNISSHLKASYKLSEDLNMGDFSSVKPIGSDTDAFTGTIDGDGHTIGGVKIKTTSKAALFGVVSSATIKNLGFINSSVYLSDYSSGEKIASFIAVARKGTLVENCYSENVTVKYKPNSSYHVYGGGFIGTIESMSKVIYCHCDVDISYVVASFQYPSFCFGGFVCTVSGSEIDACYTIGSVTFGYPAAAYTMDMGTFACDVVNSSISNMYAEINMTYGVTIDLYYFARNVDKETLEYCLNFCTYNHTPLSRYKECNNPNSNSKELNIYFSSSNYSSANDTLDSSLWVNNKIWKKGKLHPELVSYEEYVQIKNETSESNT